MGLFKSRSGKSKGSGSITPASTQSSSNSTPRDRHPDPQPPAQQVPRAQYQEPLHSNSSLSNLSTTSTLQDPPSSKPTNDQFPTHLTPYEGFIQQATQAERERLEREERIARAWKKAEDRRRSAAWPADPWRGGFGPPAWDRQRERFDSGMGPRRVAAGDERGGVRAWLGQNGFVRS